MAITEPRPYAETFSTTAEADSMKAFAFPVEKRKSAEKCDGTSPWLQKGSLAPYVSSAELPEVVANRSRLPPETVNYLMTPKGIADLEREGISLALDMRVALFLQQSILCYKMSDFIFCARGADWQIGSAPGMKYASGPTHFTIHKREAAHPSTTPTIIAYARDGSTPEGIVYLKGGSSYYRNQATNGMHEYVNGADELIDGNGCDLDGTQELRGDGKLREVSIRIINRVAQGLDPIKATQEFVGALDSEVQKQIVKLPAEDGRAFVLGLYRHKIAEIQAAMTNPVLYDRLIGVIIDSNDPQATALRDVVYKKRFDVIRLQEVVESRIAKRLRDAQEHMGAREKSFLEYMILREFWETSEKKIVEKLLGKTTAFFEQDYPSSSALRSFRTRIDNLRQKYPVLINDLMRNLRADFRELQCAEQTYRSGMFKDLRTRVKHWTQKDFCTHYAATNGRSVSQSWVSRMENLSRMPTKATYATPISQRRRFVSIQDAENCAKTFGVDCGIFFAGLFTS